LASIVYVEKGLISDEEIIGKILLEFLGERITDKLMAR